jgi:A/G-specific adenine glycosylase
MPAEFAQRLLRWYARHKRPLPWRETADPYHIWVAETMLQQTQVETVRPYYVRWLSLFPTLEALAAAPPQAVLAAWEGLGYYARARNLHRAARQVLAEFGGELPRTAAALRALPGIGRYTAGAIASIAFGLDAAVLDGNVRRVLARVYDFQLDVKSAAGEKQLWALAESLLPPGRAGDYNQALMDLGATVCTPRAPACSRCPVSGLCAARRLGLQLERPVMAARLAVPERVFAVAVVRKAARVLISQRHEGGLLGGLWAFPAVEAPPARQRSGLRTGLQADWGLRVSVGAQRGELAHAYTHFRQVARVYDCAWQSGRLQRGAGRWVRVSELNAYPMGKLDRRIADLL